MINSLVVTSRYLWIPVVPEKPLKKVTFSVGDQRVYEFLIPIDDSIDSVDCCPTYHTVYYSALPVSAYNGMTMTVSGDFPQTFASAIRAADILPVMPGADQDFPMAHFAAPGWINDPNGLVYVDGLWHLYFQYNPFDTRWQNMSWGHAVSKDLLHWTQHETALFPDSTGSMFSGSCLPIDKDHLAFFYTAAGDATDWARENASGFTQRIAISTDQGETLHKTADFDTIIGVDSLDIYKTALSYADKDTCISVNDAKVESISSAESEKNLKVEPISSTDSEKNLKVESILQKSSENPSKVESSYGNMVLDQISDGNRDPKVYKDPINGGYYMALFLSGNEYAILHSEGADYTKWSITDRFTMPPAWECPDLRLIPSHDGKTWMFWTSDGFYQTGSFDGYHFTKDSTPFRRVYLNSLAYAGQTYQIYAPEKDDSFSDRVILIHWLRTSNNGHNYTGIMGIPREMHLNDKGDLCLTPAKEWADRLTIVEPTSMLTASSIGKIADSNTGSDAGVGTEKTTWTIPEEAPLELYMTGIDSNLAIDICGQHITYNKETTILQVSGGNVDFHEAHSDVTVPDREPCTEVCFSRPVSDLRLIMDRSILEVSADGDSLNAFFEIPVYKMMGDVTVTEMCNKDSCEFRAVLSVIK